MRGENSRAGGAEDRSRAHAAHEPGTRNNRFRDALRGLCEINLQTLPGNQGHHYAGQLQRDVPQVPDSGIRSSLLNSSGVRYGFRRFWFTILERGISTFSTGFLIRHSSITARASTDDRTCLIFRTVVGPMLSLAMPEKYRWITCRLM